MSLSAVTSQNRADFSGLAEAELEIGESEYAKAESKFAAAQNDFWLNLEQWRDGCEDRVQQLQEFQEDSRLFREEREACKQCVVTLTALKALSDQMAESDCPIQVVEQYWAKHMRLLSQLSAPIALLQKTQKGLEKGTTPIGRLVQAQAQGVTFFQMPLEAAAKQDIHEESARAQSALSQMRRRSKLLNQVSSRALLDLETKKAKETQVLVTEYVHPGASHSQRMKTAIACYQTAMTHQKSAYIRVAKKVIKEVRRGFRKVPEIMEARAGDQKYLKKMLRDLRRIEGKKWRLLQVLKVFRSKWAGESVGDKYYFYQIFRDMEVPF